MALRNTSSMTNSHFHPNQPHRKCMCSPTNHPGSFRCRKHKISPRVVVAPSSSSSSSNTNYHNLDHSQMTISNKMNYSLKAIVLEIIKRHAKNDLYTRKRFQPKPSRTCMCSPTDHPGSFRCSRHRKLSHVVVAPPSSSSSSHMDYRNLDQSLMTISNKMHYSLKAILLQIIKHHSKISYLYRRKTFLPKPTRFSAMNRVAVS